MDENELRDALMRGHESLYASSPTFRAHLDYLVVLLPLWVRGMATEAESTRGEEYKAYTQMLRSARPVPVELDDSLEEWSTQPRTTRGQDTALNRLIGKPSSYFSLEEFDVVGGTPLAREAWQAAKRAAEERARREAQAPPHPQIEPKQEDWRQRAEENGVAQRARDRMREIIAEEKLHPITPEEFDKTMYLYRMGWDGNPDTLKEFEDKYGDHE